MPLTAGPWPDSALSQLLLIGLFLRNYLNVYFGFEEEKGFYIHFPALPTNPEDQEILFGGCFSFFCVALFICLFIYFTWTSHVFYHTNICSLSCPGPTDSSRLVTMQAHRAGRLCCSLHPSLVHLSRNMAVFQMLQGT